MKVTVTINDDLMKEIDEYADSIYMPRSTFLALAAKTYIDQQKVMKLMPDMVEMYKKESTFKGGCENL